MRQLMPSDVAGAVVDGCRNTVEDFNSGIIKREIAMTERLMGSISNALGNRIIANLRWKAYTLTGDRGIAAEEKRHGADVLGVLTISLCDFHVTKGFLLQAKILEPNKLSSESEWERFQEQCKLMLDRTCEAFAVIYSRQCGIRFIPAAMILDIKKTQIFEVGWRTLFGFFKSHIKCEIGDRRLNNPSVDVLDALVRKRSTADLDYGSQFVIALKVSDERDRS